MKSYLLLCSDASLLALDEFVDDDEFLVRFVVVVVEVEEVVDDVDRTTVDADVELSTSECVPRDLDFGISSDFPNFSYFPGSESFFDGRSSLKKKKLFSYSECRLI